MHYSGPVDSDKTAHDFINKIKFKIRTDIVSRLISINYPDLLNAQSAKYVKLMKIQNLDPNNTHKVIIVSMDFYV